MKKLLLGTSALIGATAIVASASAAAPELTISGSLDVRIVGGETPVHSGVAGFDMDGRPLDSDDNPIATDVGFNEVGYDISTGAHSRSEIVFNAEGESDGGTRYGANIQYRYLASSTDEAFIFVGGDWGTVQLGQNDGASDSIPYWGSVAPGAYMIDGWETGLGRHGFGTGDSEKISYFSNDLGGFSFGLSVSEGGAEGVTAFENVYEIMAQYSAETQSGNATIGFSYKSGSIADREAAAAVQPSPGNVGSAAVTARNGNTHEDLGEWGIGATVSFGAFSIAVGYTDAGESGQPKEADAAEARSAYGIGVAYDLGGGMAIGLAYAEAESTNDTNGATAGGGVDTVRSVLALDFGFPIMDGMAGYAGIARTETEIGEGANNSVNATTYLVGTTVSF